MAIGLGKLFQDMLKIGVADAAQKNIPDMVGRMFAKKEPTTDEVLQILEDERKQRATEFVAGGQSPEYKPFVDDAPNIEITLPYIRSTSGSVIPQQTIVPQIVEAPRGTVVRNLGSLFLEVERINANIAAVTKAMRDSAILEKKYRDELIKSREQALSERDKLSSGFRASRGRSKEKGFFGRQLQRGKEKARGISEGFLEASLFAFALETGAMIVNAIKKSFDPPPPPPPASGDLADLISGGEGSYESVNFGVAGDAKGKPFKHFFKKTLAETTIREVDTLQKQGKVAAVGRFQITPRAMPQFIQYLEKKGIDPKTAKLDKGVQDMYFDYFLSSKRQKVGQYLRGGNVTLDEATLEVAAEFAAVGVPYDMEMGSYGTDSEGRPIPARKIKKGESLYADYRDAKNKSQAGLMEKVRATLEKERKANQARGRGRAQPGKGGPNTVQGQGDDYGGQRVTYPDGRTQDYVPGQTIIGPRSSSSSSVGSASREIASAGSGSVRIISQYYDSGSDGGATALGSATGIPDREPKRPGGVYEEYMGVA